MPKELSDGEGADVEAPKHGPFSNQQMQQWKEAGYFEENDMQFCVFIQVKNLDSDDWLLIDEI